MSRKRTEQLGWLLMALLVLACYCQPLEAKTLAATIAMSTERPQKLESVEQVEPESSLPETIGQAVKEDVIAQNPSLDADHLQITKSEANTWPDGCLGLAKDGEFCTQALVSGYRVSLTDGNQAWIYRTDGIGAILRIETEKSLED